MNMWGIIIWASVVCLKLVSPSDQFSPRGVFARAPTIGLCEWEYLLIEFVSCVIISSYVIYCFLGFFNLTPENLQGLY